MTAAEITGTVESLRGPYGDDFYILSVSTPDIVNVTGNFIRPEVGDCYRFAGKWDVHKSYGKQFKARNAVMETPKDVRGVQLYLANKFPSVGPATAERLYDRFGDSLFDVMENAPEKLVEVRGISETRAKQISDAYKRLHTDKANDLFFATHKISNATVSALMKRYGSTDAVVSKLKQNPYRLISDVHGIGWKKADTIGNSMNISRTSPFRIRAGIIHALGEATVSGHCYLPEPELLAACKKLLQCDEETIQTELNYLSGEEKIIVEYEDGNPIYYNVGLWKAESFVAEKLGEMARW